MKKLDTRNKFRNKNKDLFYKGSTHRSLQSSHRWAVGTHALLEALKNFPERCKCLYLKSDWESSLDLRQMVEICTQKKIPFQIKSENFLKQLAASHQSAALELTELPSVGNVYKKEDFESMEKGVIVLLDGIEDPHNLGAIFRTSWLMGGVKGIYSALDRSVGLSPIVHKVACGGVEHVPFQQISHFVNEIDLLKKAGFWVFGLDHKSKKSIFDLKLPPKVIWVLGSEDKGLRKTTEKICDEKIFVPQQDAAASYNVSVTLGMTLFESYRQIFSKNEANL